MSDGAIRHNDGRWPWQRTLLHEGPDAPIYMRQWFAWRREWIKRFGGIQLHHFHSDDGDVPHDHPSWMLCIVLWGRALETVYLPEAETGQLFGPGQWRHLPKWGMAYLRRYAPDWVSFRRRLPRIRLYRLGSFTHRIHSTRNLWARAARPARRAGVLMYDIGPAITAGFIMFLCIGAVIGAVAVIWWLGWTGVAIIGGSIALTLMLKGVAALLE